MNTQTYTPTVNGRLGLPPVTDVFEDAQGYLLVADLPGVSADKVDISLEEGKVVVLGKRAPLVGDGPEQQLRRAFTLPEDVDVAAIQAKLDGGVLQVTLPKKAESQPRRIPVARA